MTKFEPSEHAELLSQFDNYSGRNVEYWSKGEKDENLSR